MISNKEIVLGLMHPSTHSKKRFPVVCGMYHREVWCTPMWDKMLPAPAPPLVFFVLKATYDDLVTSPEESHNTHQPVWCRPGWTKNS